MAEQRDVHGFQVLYEDDADQGVDFLDHGLDYAEAKVLFQQAHGRGKAPFQDAQRRDFTLTYNGDGTYSVVKRKVSKGFFSGWF